MTEINWPLIERLKDKPHPNVNGPPDGPPDLPTHIGEALMKQRIAHHLLDLADIPLGEGYAQDIDGRVYLAIYKILEQGERLARLASWHSRITGPAGTFDDYCARCSERWPCEDRRMADGTHDDIVNGKIWE
jgi:hypothetical protein